MHPNHVRLGFTNPLSNKLIFLHVPNVFLDIFVMNPLWPNQKTVQPITTVRRTMRLLVMEIAMAAIPVTTLTATVSNSDVHLADIPIQKTSEPKPSVLHVPLDSTVRASQRTTLNHALLDIIVLEALQLVMITVVLMELMLTVTTVVLSVPLERIALKGLSHRECVSRVLSQKTTALNPKMIVSIVDLVTFVREKSSSMDHPFIIKVCLVSVKLDMHVISGVSVQMVNWL